MVSAGCAESEQGPIAYSCQSFAAPVIESSWSDVTIETSDGHQASECQVLMGVHEVAHAEPGAQLGTLGTLVQVHCKRPFGILLYFELGDPRGWKPGHLEVISPVRYRFDGPSSLCISASELPPVLAPPPLTAALGVELDEARGEAAPPPALVTPDFLRSATIEFQSAEPLQGFAGLTTIGSCGRALETVSVVADFRVDEAVMLRDLEDTCFSK